MSNIPPVNQPPTHQTTVIIQQPPKKPRVWLWVLVGVCALCLVPAAMNTGKEKPVSGNEKVASSPGRTEAPVEKPLQVTAEQVFSDFKANVVSAEAKYDGKKLLLTGTVDDIGKDLMDDPYVSFKVGGQFEIASVQAFFTDEEEAKLGDIKKGQKLTILTEYKGEIAKSVILHLSEIKG